MGRKGLSVTKTSINEQVGVSMGTFAIIDALYLGAYMLGQFVSGNIGDRIGARRLVGFGMLAIAIIVAVFGSLAAAVPFAIVFCLNGFAQSTGWPGTTRAMAEWTSKENRGRIMGFWATCYAAGGFLATNIATRLRDDHGWRAAFYGPAIWIALVGLLVLFFLRPGPGASDAMKLDDEVDVDRAKLVKARSDDEAQRAKTHRRLLRSKVLWLYGASYFCMKLIRYSLLFWLPVYLEKGVGFDKDTAGYASSAFDAGGILGIIVIGATSDKIQKYSRSFLPALALCALAGMSTIYWFAGASSVAANAILLALIGVTLFGPDSLISGAAAQDEGGTHGSAMATGFVNGVGSIGGLLSGFVTVGVSKAFGWEKLFLVFVVLSVVAAIALLPTVVRRTPAAADPGT